ncbi:MAG: phosphoribosylformylglycinamidine synthase [Patescibacteria group bacterium]
MATTKLTRERKSHLKTIMLEFFRQEPDGHESHFLAEVRAWRDTDKQLETYSRDLVPFFRYLPTHVVTPKPTLRGPRVIIVGTMLSRETPGSSVKAQILEDCGIRGVLRLEEFRRIRIPDGVNRREFIEEVCDPVTEQVYRQIPQTFFLPEDVPPVVWIPLLSQGVKALHDFSEENNLDFDESQLQYIAQIYRAIGKDPSDVAMFMLAQIWSDHCCHKVFNARLIIDGVEKPYTLFDLVRAPYEAVKGIDKDVMIAFHDNASAVRGYKVPILIAEKPGYPSRMIVVYVHLDGTISAETHNYPTFQSPFPGRATEIGGQIRDTIGCGRGSEINFGGNGTMLGSLRFPNGYRVPGHYVPGREYLYPDDKATAIKIFVDGLRGWHSYANCFGVSDKLGFFYAGAMWRPRRDAKGKIWFERIESIKPFVYGIGIGIMRREHIKKAEVKPGYAVVRIGNNARLIGWMGGSGASTIGGTHGKKFDLNAVQRGTPFLERLFYEVIRVCNSMGIKTPILSESDSGAGGLASMLFDLIGKLGGTIYLGRVKRGDRGMSDAKVFVCEWQESQGLIISKAALAIFKRVCEREGCPVEVLGEITGDGKFTVYSESGPKEVVKKAAAPLMALDVADAAKHMPRITIEDNTPQDVRLPLVIPRELTIADLWYLVSKRVEVGSKRCVIRTVDGSIGGRTVLNQYCGPWSTPVNDCAMETFGYRTLRGQAAALGVSPFKTILDPAAGARMAFAEMITNLMNILINGANPEKAMRKIKTILNWGWAANLNPHDGEIARMVAAAEAIRDLLIGYGSLVFGGKDSGSLAIKLMEAIQRIVKSMPTIVFGGLVTIPDVSYHVTPDLKLPGESCLVLLDIANGRRRLGGSSLAACFDGQLGKECPDLDEPALLHQAFTAMQLLLANQLVLSSHDVSDGGLLTTAIEMAMAGGCGLNLSFDGPATARQQCFAEEVGNVVEIHEKKLRPVEKVLKDHGVPYQIIGATVKEQGVRVGCRGRQVMFEDLWNLRRSWEKTGFELSKLLICPDWAKREWRNTKHRQFPIHRLTFEPQNTPRSVLRSAHKHPLMVLRPKGANCQDEMQEACHQGGFDVVDVHFNDLPHMTIADLKPFRTMVIPGGFADGDEFGAAVGMIMRIKRNAHLRKLFNYFLKQQDKLVLGICLGAEFGVRYGMAPLPDLPEEQRPLFTRIKSGTFNHQWIRLLVKDSPAVMLRGMAGSILPAYVANGEGYFNCEHSPEILERIFAEHLAPLLYVDDRGHPSVAPPYSPSGSKVGAVCDPTGRHLFIMAHVIDRFFRMIQAEYIPSEFQHLLVSPWFQMMHNARIWCDQNRRS